EPTGTWPPWRVKVTRMMGRPKNQTTMQRLIQKRNHPPTRTTTRHQLLMTTPPPILLMGRTVPEMLATAVEPGQKTGQMTVRQPAVVPVRPAMAPLAISLRTVSLRAPAQASRLGCSSRLQRLASGHCWSYAVVTSCNPAISCAEPVKTPKALGTSTVSKRLWHIRVVLAEDIFDRGVTVDEVYDVINGLLGAQRGGNCIGHVGTRGIFIVVLTENVVRHAPNTTDLARWVFEGQ